MINRTILVCVMAFQIAPVFAHDLSNSYFFSSLQKADLQQETSENSTVGVRFGIGFMLSPQLAIELGYGQYGDIKTDPLNVNPTNEYPASMRGENQNELITG